MPHEAARWGTLLKETSTHVRDKCGKTSSRLRGIWLVTGPQKSVYLPLNRLRLGSCKVAYVTKFYFSFIKAGKDAAWILMWQHLLWDFSLLWPFKKKKKKIPTAMKSLCSQQDWEWGGQWSEYARNLGSETKVTDAGWRKWAVRAAAHNLLPSFFDIMET